MAAPSFLAPTVTLRPSTSTQSTFATTPSIHGHPSRDYSDCMDAPTAPSRRTSPDDMCGIIFRGLPKGITEQSIRSMLLGANKDIVKVTVFNEEEPKDSGLCAALVTFNNEKTASATAKRFNNRLNVDNTAQMVVETIAIKKDHASNQSGGTSPVGTSSTGSSATSSTLNSHHVSPPEGRVPPSPFDMHMARFHARSLEEHGAFPPSAHLSLNPLRSPQSPTGGRVALQEPLRVSGKELIQNATSDDEANEILSENAWSRPPWTGPAWEGLPFFLPDYKRLDTLKPDAPMGRRATAPQIPISEMSNLTLNTTSALVGTPDPNNFGSAITSPTSAFSPTGPSSSHQSSRANRSNRERLPVNLADQYPPCNTLYVGNLPEQASEEELKALFSRQKGYKRLCFRIKANGPMCFVEFDTISFATKALNELHGFHLHNGRRGGIRLSFSKNPLGVRSNQNPANGVSPAHVDAFANRDPVTLANAHGPPPGLSRPPGLSPSRQSWNAAATAAQPFHTQGYSEGHQWQQSRPSDYNTYNNYAFWQNNNGMPHPNRRSVRFSNEINEVRWN